MKLHRDLDVSQKTVWFVLHRIREAFINTDEALFAGPVEADETSRRREGQEHAREQAP